ncbi:high affinity cAMP phosphodiesterase/cyclic-nucleotide phosphodiesterase [Blumeria hordei DH14]|uniref:Phosphodiesterase n=1 Tax=Blumeria graminis f. sp. hordei (strain DH14) TaxID=546991 RepID=N1JQ47_BLUG1|nr:high affinity cAMP phosphodiesterase/cyclic-nucleotide phosphodiesterase [Blumeria hordei DH14]
MNHIPFNILYVDRNAQENCIIKQENLISTTSLELNDSIKTAAESSTFHSRLVQENLQKLLRACREVHLCTSGRSCLAKLSDLNQTSIIESIPTIVLIDIPFHGNSSCKLLAPSLPESSIWSEQNNFNNEEKEIYGLKLLESISCEIQEKRFSNMVIPMALIKLLDSDLNMRQSKSHANNYYHYSEHSSDGYPKHHRSPIEIDQAIMMQSLEAGAADILASPLQEERLSSLARARKRSWVGMDDQKPYAYLREAMVSGLMDGICHHEDYNPPINWPNIIISPDRKETVAIAINSWNFSAHEFTDDELLHAAVVMLHHTLTMPELEPWRLSMERAENLTKFVIASRSAYNTFVPYHNFRHVVDVLQACFFFLLELRKIPPYHGSNNFPRARSSPLADSIKPLDALTLLITAVGHDVGHPGVNNAFLVSLNAPLAQLYNDRSVLESFHCAAYSQILRRHWPTVFRETGMRQLMINIILATDMGLHFDYMKKTCFGEQRTLACSLLIKCADISNVARKHEISSKWTIILTDEFARQASMEKDLGIPTALFAPPVRETIELGKSQIGFINLFALPLFEGVVEVMPAMLFSIRELLQNKSAWQDKISQNQPPEQGSKGLDMHDINSSHSTSVENPDVSPQNFGSKTTIASEKTNSMMLLDDTWNKRSRNHSYPMIKFPSNEVCVSTYVEDVSPTNSLLNFSFKKIPQNTSISINPVPLPEHDKYDHTLVEARRSSAQLPSNKLVLGRNTAYKGHGSEGHSSNKTEDSSFSTDEWPPQETLENLRLTPSTQGSSVTSDYESVESFIHPHSPHMTTFPSKNSDICEENDGDGEESGRYSKSVLVVQKIRVLQKKSSRFRMNFWKRSKNASRQSIPAGGYNEEGSIDTR